MMPNNDIEVFDHLLADTDINVEIDYLAYAIFGFRKRQWIDHHKSRNDGPPPNQAEIDGWISELTNYDFVRMRSEAADIFDVAAREYLEEDIKRQKQEAVDSSILSEVKKFTSPTRHIAIALVMAIVAPIILGGLIFFAGLFDKSFPLHFYTSPPTAGPGQ
jgi:hypothetical protein